MNIIINIIFININIQIKIYEFFNFGGLNFKFCKWLLIKQLFLLNC